MSNDEIFQGQLLVNKSKFIYIRKDIFILLANEIEDLRNEVIIDDELCQDESYPEISKLLKFKKKEK